MKAKAAVAVVVLVAGAAAGWQFYTDKQLEKFYTQSQAFTQDKRISISDGSFDMGLFSGSAGAVIKITPDLCRPNVSFQIKVEDKIRRTWSGHEIQSKVYLVSGNVSAATNLDIHTQIGWNGSGVSRVVLPAGSKGSPERGSINWQEASSDIRWHRGKDGIAIDNFKLKVPGVTLLEPGTTVFLNDLEFQSNLGGGTQRDFFKDGSETLHVGQLDVQNASTSARFSNMKLNWNQKTNGDTLGVDMAYSLETIQAADKTFKNLQVNLKSDLKRQLLDDLAGIIRTHEQRCVTPEESRQQMAKAMNSILSNGVRLESAKNEISLNNSKAVWNADFTIPATSAPNSDNMKQLADTLVEAMQYQFTLTLDKTIFAALGSSVPQSDAEWQQELDKARSKLPPQIQLRQQGDKIVFSSHKP